LACLVIILKDIFKNWRAFLVGFGIWTVVGVSFGLRTHWWAQMNASPTLFWQTVPNYMVDFYIWGAVSPLIFWLCHRFPIERGNIAGRSAFHLLAGMVFVFVVTLITIPTLWYLGLVNMNNHPTLSAFFNNMIINPFMVHQGLLAYWGTVVVAHAIEYSRQAQAGRTRASELSAQLANAQLAALKMQIHPHFLFNTLNSISALLHKDVEVADRMIARLSDFLRMTLRNSGTSAVTLEQELEFLTTYLEIEKIRFQDKLLVEMEIDDQALDAKVPNLILQPLVENAVRHGVAKQTGVGRLNIQANRVGDRLVVNIEDNGPGPNGIARPKNGHGVGLANTRARLEQFYKEFHFEIEGKNGKGGTIVSIDVPYLS
jgi:two-component system LytT family sensor kinase